MNVVDRDFPAKLNIYSIYQCTKIFFLLLRASSINSFDWSNLEIMSYSTLSFMLMVNDLNPSGNGCFGISQADKI